MKKINVIGAGLAGSECANFLANHGYKVCLYEMRPSQKAVAHHTGKFCELVCSNSLKSSSKENAAGLLKLEMEILDSIVMESAKISQVPAGQALAVDRDLFSSYIDEKLRNNPFIEVHNEEVIELEKDAINIVCSGPLTSDNLSSKLKEILGQDYLYFYDASAPLVTKESINFSKAYYKSRYNKGDSDDYINCPFTKEEFDAFYTELIKAQRVELHNFEKEIHFEACMPIESLAVRGPKTLTFGPLKPVGLEKDGEKRPYAVVQLRKDDKMDKTYNIVGFQTNLLFPEQKRVFRMIPGLENAEFVRYGVMHRNTYICSPKYLDATLQLRSNRDIFFGGQIVGVEGYIESAATGIVAAINVIRYLENKELVVPPSTTVLGSLLRYISSANPSSFQPMNANYGVLLNKGNDKLELADRSLKDLKEWREKLCL